MKRMIAAVSFAVLAVPAFADDRGMPYEQLQVDRGLPAATVSHERTAGGSTAVTPEYRGLASGIWANDWNFIAPAA